MKLVDLQRNRVVSVLDIKEQAQSKDSQSSSVYSLDWNSDGFLAIASTEEIVYIKEFDGEALAFLEYTSLNVKCPSRCVSWNPLNPKLLAAGLFNGNLIIFDDSTAQVKQILRASVGPHDNRVMQIQWHPLFEHMIAAAGSDCNVHVFDLREATDRKL